jgi:hypothetical protein
MTAKKLRLKGPKGHIQRSPSLLALQWRPDGNSRFAFIPELVYLVIYIYSIHMYIYSIKLRSTTQFVITLFSNSALLGPFLTEIQKLLPCVFSFGVWNRFRVSVNKQAFVCFFEVIFMLLQNTNFNVNVHVMRSSAHSAENNIRVA